jgi:hypothetical protein
VGFCGDEDGASDGAGSRIAHLRPGHAKIPAFRAIYGLFGGEKSGILLEGGRGYERTGVGLRVEIRNGLRRSRFDPGLDENMAMSQVHVFFPGSRRRSALVGC